MNVETMERMMERTGKQLVVDEAARLVLGGDGEGELDSARDIVRFLRGRFDGAAQRLEALGEMTGVSQLDTVIAEAVGTLQGEAIKNAFMRLPLPCKVEWKP